MSGKQRCKSNNSSDEEMMILTFKFKDEDFVRVKVSDTVKIVKAMICEKEGIEEDEHELIFAGGPLWDELRIKDCGITVSSTVDVANCKTSQINLYFKTPANEKTFRLKVSKWYTVENIKSLILIKEGIPGETYILYHAGKAFEGCNTVESVNIKNNDTLQMIAVRKERVSIIVETPKGPIRGDVRSAHTVLDVKKILESMINIPSEGLELFKGSMKLHNMETLAYYYINENNKLKLQPAPYQISVKDLRGKTFTLEVLESDTIGFVKSKIAEEDEMLLEELRILFKGRILKDEKNLASYCIVKGSTVHLCLSLGGPPKRSFQLI